MSTPRSAIVGYPVSFSRSPMLHGFWLKHYGLAGEYGRCEVAPDGAQAFFADFERHGLAGCNVTAPHKEAAFAALDEPDDTARALGAANTLWLQDGRLFGANTDVYGFLANLDDAAPGWDAMDAPALVFGAGGASRAIVYGLLQRGVGRVLLANRTKARAEQVAAQFNIAGAARVTPLSWDEGEARMGEARLLVNTTSLGMKGKPALELDLTALPGDAVVADLVYVPLETPLLKRARGRGLRAVDGLGMLLHQGVPGFERWFGVRPHVTRELRELLVEDLRAKGQLEA